MREPGLIYRRAFCVDMGRVVIEEKWDIETPMCPLIKSPWAFASLPLGRFVTMQSVIPREQFDASRVELYETQN